MRTPIAGNARGVFLTPLGGAALIAAIGIIGVPDLAEQDSATSAAQSDSKAAVSSDEARDDVTVARSSERLAAKPETVAVDNLTGDEVEFTQSQEGLQAYLDVLAQQYDVRIAVQQLDGDWSASVRADESAIAASTYKTYVAVYVLNLVQDGTLSHDTVLGGQSVQSCLESMITVSDNDCAYVFLNYLGRDQITQFFQARGYTTSLEAQDGAIWTSVADLVTLMSQLDSGEILDGAERDYLLELMGEQVYREDIPAGSSGTVSDKVGFLWEYLNDVGIVTTDTGRYALAIISDGESWSTIANITSNIEAIMYSES